MTEKINVPSINKLIISGRLVEDSDLRYTQNNTAFLTFRIASSKRYFKDGEWKESTIFLKVISWSKNNEKIGERLKKGTPVIVEGSLAINKWQDKNTGEDRYEYQIKADRIHNLVRNTGTVTLPNSSNEDLDKKIDELDKDFDGIVENEQNGGTDDIPF